ncbi:MAG: hypothetical protein JXA69_12020 [Phycisphaerae bacterium]|nr:hypothetical protein [Phycisphaerae bacterium]
MAVDKHAHTQGQGGDKAALATARGRRFFFGANVIVVTLIALALVVAVNWISQAQYKRIDVASSGLFGLSDRTKRILDESAAPKITFTSLYTSTAPDKARDKYLPRIRDLFGELEDYSDKIEVRHLIDDDAKRELIDRIKAKYGGKSGEYREAVDLALGTWADTAEWLTATAQSYGQLMQNRQWISGFATFAKIQAELTRDLDDLQQAHREVEEAAGGQGLPRYEEAKRKIETTNSAIKGHLEEAQKWFVALEKAAAMMADPQAEFAAASLGKLEELRPLVTELQVTIGDPADESVPDDATPVLQSFARQAKILSAWLTAERSRVDEFVGANDVVSGHFMWAVKVNPLVQIELPDVLSMTQQNLDEWDQQIRQALGSGQPKDVLQSVVRRLRQVGSDVANNLGVWDKQLQAFLATWQKIDPPSKELLEQAKAGELFTAQIAGLTEIETKLAALPELKMEDTVSKFDQDNLVVVETEDQVQVIDFDTMWPQSDPMGMPGDEDIERRVFNGDAAVSAAILALGHKEPFATVVLTVYEPSSGPPQMPGQPPQQQPRYGPIPSRALTKIRERLEQSNFAVKEWNLANDEPPPAAEGDRPNLYVMLPPAGPPQQNPFQRPPPDEKNFGDAEVEKVRAVLKAENARAIFVAGFQWPQVSFFGAQPAVYGYEGLLRDDWGIDVRFSQRVIRGVPDKRDAERYGVSISRWGHMRLNSFNEDNPIGAPLRARRCLFLDVCPVVQAETVPEGVTIDPVLSVPATGGRSEFWAEPDVIHVIRQIRSPKSDGTVVKSPEAVDPPFTVMLTAKNTETKSEILVHGAGMGIVDRYLDERVMRLGAEEQISFDPPPTENGELLLNALYWLADKPTFIAAGPVTAPPVQPIETGTQHALQAFTIAWAILVLAAGGVVMYVRRR